MAQAFQYHKSKFNPDVEGTATQVLYEGKRVRRTVSYTSIRSRNTGEFHHDCVSFKTYQKSGEEWKLKPSSSITLSNDKNEELSQAVHFIQACRGHDFEEGGRYLADRDEVKPLQEGLMEQLLQLEPAQQREWLSQLLTRMDLGDLGDQLKVLEGQPQLSSLGVAAQLALFRQALRQYKSRLKKKPESLGAFLFTQPVLLGLGSYEDFSALLQGCQIAPTARLWRSPDNQLRLCVCANPEIEPLFLPGAVSWYPHPELSEHLGRIQQDCESLMAQRESWLQDWGLDPGRIQILLIVGRSADDAEALRAQQRFIAAQERLEIMSYDQLYQRALRSLKAQQAQSKDRHGAS